MAALVGEESFSVMV